MSKTHCKRGHEFSDENTRHKNGKRHCRQCAVLQARKWQLANPDKVKANCRRWHQENKERRYAYKRQLNYGVTPEQFEKLLSLQNRACAICHVEFTQTPDIDHDHKTGIVRGLLCTNCNNGLGRFKDNVEALESAIKYLTKGLANGLDIIAVSNKD